MGFPFIGRASYEENVEDHLMSVDVVEPLRLYGKGRRKDG